eukprot:scaffold206200_cov26-Tisochrysis_lutea.AAC.2
MHRAGRPGSSDGPALLGTAGRRRQKSASSMPLSRCVQPRASPQAPPARLDRGRATRAPSFPRQACLASVRAQRRCGDGGSCWRSVMPPSGWRR